MFAVVEYVGRKTMVIARHVECAEHAAEWNIDFPARVRLTISTFKAWPASHTRGPSGRIDIIGRL